MSLTISHNRAHLVSDVKNTAAPAPIKINQDANIYVAEITTGNTVSFDLANGRQGYLLCMEGSAQLEGAHGSESLDRHDAAEVFGSNSFTVTPLNGQSAHLLLVEMEFTGIGRSDL